jgi:lipopolysaccharide transport system ATP-binding protein
MMSDAVICVENLSKKYEITVGKLRHNTLRDQIADSFSSLFHRNGRPPGKKEVFWALRDVSFEVKPGEVIGVIGQNGAGKSTLLKILSRITVPTAGFAEIRGRIGSLLEVGVGFHPELSGRENIYLNGAVLGMKKAEIERRFDEIVAFAEVERFIDTPVKRYSSGMYVRLAFGVAAHLEPEILIVDEVLAVGDAAFQKKCLGKMGDVARQGRTVLFVSHNMAAVRNLCSRAFLLKSGRIETAGAVEDVVRAYLMFDGEQTNYPSLEERQDRSGTGSVRAVSLEVRAHDCTNGGPPRTGAPAEFIIGYAVREERPVRKLYAAIGVSDTSGNGLFACSTAMLDADFSGVPSRGQIVCQIDYLPLVPGKYWVRLKLSEYEGQSYYRVADEIRQAASFEVVEGGDSGFSGYVKSWGTHSVVVPHRWALRPCNG